MSILRNLFSGTQTAAGMTAQEAKARIDSARPPFILDVRDPGEYREGHIEHAVLVPLNQLSGAMDRLPKDADILCVCRSGARSGVAASQLAAAGYRAINLRGGMIAWESARYPVKRGM